MTSSRTVLHELRNAQKTARGVSLYSRYVNRPLGRLIAVGAIRTGLTPNGVTFVSACFTAVGLVLIACLEPSPLLGLGISLSLIVGFAFDSADGQVARYTKRGSSAGEWLDHVVDGGKMVALHTAVLISWVHSQGQTGAILLIPLGYQFVAVVMFVGGTLAELLLRAKRAAGGVAAEAAPSTVRSIALLPADYGILALSFVLWGVSGVHRVVYTVLLILNAVVLLALLVRWFRALNAR